MPLDALSAALLALVQSGEGIPITVHVTPSDEVQELRARISELEGEVKHWKETLQHSEFKRGAERQITENLLELLRANNIRIPRDVFKYKPDGDAGAG